MSDRVKTLCGYDGVYNGKHMFYVKIRQQENTNHTASNKSWFVFFDDITDHQTTIGCGTLGYYEDLWSKSGPDYQVLDIGSYELDADTIRDYPDLIEIWNNR